MKPYLPPFARRRCFVVPAALLVVTYLSATARAEAPTTQPGEPSKSWIRFVDNGPTGGRLETAITTYRNDAGAIVDLVSAVHIGERSYFQGLSRAFDHYDAVLYEMVKPKDAVLPRPGVRDEEQSHSAVSEFQRLLKDTLNLSFQLDEIDYTRRNFVHADLDAETFQKMQADRGESFEMLMLKQLMNAFTQPDAQDNALANEDPEKMLREMIRVFTRPDAERQLKLMIARHMQDMDAKAMGLDGPGGSVIVTERNKAAIKALTNTLQSGKKRLAIFYGAAHMPDMAQRLHEMGFKPVSTDWKLAWDLTIRYEEPSAIEQVLEGAFKLLDDAAR